MGTRSCIRDVKESSVKAIQRKKWHLPSVSVIQYLPSGRKVSPSTSMVLGLSTKRNPLKTHPHAMGRCGVKTRKDFILHAPLKVQKPDMVGGRRHSMLRFHTRKGSFLLNNINIQMVHHLPRRSGKMHRCCLQDGDPSQNSKKALIALQEANFELFLTPPRSPELNPIENMFALVKRELCTQAILGLIERESFGKFSSRVKATLYSISKKHINDIIDSYGKRLHELIKTKGGKIEY